MKAEFGNRMKMYEKLAQQKFIPTLPVCIRLDGRSFSSWTRGLKRPYDAGMMSLMRDLTIALVKETGAVIGYTQSDEISLILHQDNMQSQIYFDGKIQKIISSAAAFTSSRFNKMVEHYIDNPGNKLANFDCRAWQVPNKTEATNTLLWREQDATKNSISMAAHVAYSHRELLNKNSTEKQDMLMEKGVNWNDLPKQFKRGVFVQKCKEVKRFTTEELDKLPLKHEARINPDLHVLRTLVKTIDMPPFTKVINKNEVVFLGQQPLVSICGVPK